MFTQHGYGIQLLLPLIPANGFSSLLEHTLSMRHAIWEVSGELQVRATGRDRHEKGKIRSREKRVSPRDRTAHRYEWGAWPEEPGRDTQARGLAVRNSGTQPSKVTTPESSWAARKGFDAVEPKLLCANQGSLGISF